MFRSFCALAPLSAAVLVFGSPASADAQLRSDPLDARASVPPLRYQSPLAGYRRYADENLAPWKEANETAARIGGWRAYAREAQQGAAPGAGASAPATGHHGHTK